ncbi:MAG: tetratricopeptide repeat protein [Capsulimonadaceae bacterium]
MVPVPKPPVLNVDLCIPPLLAAVVLAVYDRVCGYAFGAWDDTAHITNNPFLNPISPHALAHFWSQPHLELYIPVTYTVWTALCFLSRLRTPVAVAGLGTIGYDARVFHSANLLVHVTSTLLCYFLIRRVLTARAGTPVPGLQVRTAAAAGALLFGLHPVQVESVAWISEMKGLLSGFFALVALDQFVRFRLSPPAAAPNRRRPLASGTQRRLSGHFVAATIALVAALLSKPSAIGVPLIAAVVDVFFLQTTPRDAARTLWPWALVMLAAAWIGRQSQPSVGSSLQVALWARPLIAGDTLAFYAGHLLAPVRLGLDYGRQPQIVLRHPVVYFTWVIPAAIACILAWQRNRRPEFAGAALIMVCAILPVLGLVPFDFQAISTAADRYLYLAMLGPALALGVWLCRSERSTWPYVAAAAVLVSCAVRSAVQVPTWRDSRALFRNTLRVNPHSWTAWTDQGAIAMNNNDVAAGLADFQRAVAAKPDDERSLRYLGKTYRLLGQADKERDLYLQTIKTYPACGSAHLLLGIRLALDHNRAGAEAEFRKALKIDPKDSEAHNALGDALLEDGSNDEAVDEFRTFQALKPYEPEAYQQMGRTLLAMGQYEEAADQDRHAISLAPSDPYGYFHLAEAYKAMQDDDDAITAYRESIRYEGDIAAAHSNLAEILRDRGRLAEAVSEWRAALRYDPARPATHDDLAGALRQLGNTIEATAEYQAALRLNPTDPVAQAALTKPGAH